MTVESGLNGHSELTSPVFVQQNQLRVAKIIRAEQARLQADIDSHNGSAIHHQGQVELLEEMMGRVSYLVEVYDVREPIDEGFVYDVIAFLKASDYDRANSGNVPSRTTEIEHIAGARASAWERSHPQDAGTNRSWLLKIMLLAEGFTDHQTLAYPSGLVGRDGKPMDYLAMTRSGNYYAYLKEQHGPGSVYAMPTSSKPEEIQIMLRADPQEPAS